MKSVNFKSKCSSIICLLLLPNCSDEQKTVQLNENPAHSLNKRGISSGNAVFIATEGVSGTENQLAYNDIISLRVIGTSGPNEGTLVRITNDGSDSFMNVGLPTLSGADPNYFKLEIENPATSALGLTSTSTPTIVASPLVALPKDARPGIVMRLDTHAVAQLGTLQHVMMQDFLLPDLGPVTLELEHRDLPITADSHLVIDGQEVAGGLRTLVNDLQILRGAVSGMPDSRVFLTLSEAGMQGFIALTSIEDRFVHVTTDELGVVRLVRQAQLNSLGLKPPQNFCQDSLQVPGQQSPVAALPIPEDGFLTSNLTIDDRTVKKLRLAIESDFEFFELFNSSSALTSYVTGLIGAVSDQFFTDVQTVIEIAYLGIHTNSNDGWSDDAGVHLLDEFRRAWRSNFPVAADLAHFLSGKSFGGADYHDVLCNQNFGFAVSGGLSGMIDWSSWTGQAAGFTWDFFVVAHELGHNFGSLHTHDCQQYNPPIDRCFGGCDGGPQLWEQGTIMSYCYLGPGGMASIDLVFHPRNAAIMRARVNASCLNNAPIATLAPGDFVQYRLRFNPLNSAGTRSATLEFAHDATNEPRPFQLELSGTAVPRRPTGVVRK